MRKIPLFVVAKIAAMLIVFALLFTGAFAQPLAQVGETITIQCSRASLTAVNGGFQVFCELLASVTPPAATATAVPPTATRTRVPPTPTSTGTIIPPTATVLPGADHDLTAWHPATAELHHSHGVDPMSTIFAPFIADFFPKHGIPIVSHPWLTSPVENAWPDGKHDGFFWLYEENTGCDQFDNGGNQDPAPCVKAYLLQVHSIRTASELRARFHSESVIALVCQTGGGPPCDIVYTGGHADYGQNHSRYKRDICWADLANPYPESAGSNIYLNQPPYRTQIGSAQTGIFWSSLINSLGRTYLEPDPSNVLAIAWNDLDVFSSEAVDPANCFNPAFDKINAGARGTRHQVFSVYIDTSQFPRPFEGWTDVHGNRMDSCSDSTAGCVPIYVGANVPQGTAYLNRQVTHGDASVAPIFDFYNGFDVEMNPYQHP